MRFYVLNNGAFKAAVKLRPTFSVWNGEVASFERQLKSSGESREGYIGCSRSKRKEHKI